MKSSSCGSLTVCINEPEPPLTPLWIAGLQRFSLSDFPGRTAAIVFTQGCNFRCAYCHNPGLIPAAGRNGTLMPEAELFRFLAGRRGRLDGVVISGGEPVVQAGLIDFMRRLRRLGYAVKLDTNGSSPAVLAQILQERLVDFIAMDIKAPPHRYGEITGVNCDTAAVLESVRMITAANVINHEFRTTVAPGQLSETDVLSCGRLLTGASLYVLRHAAGIFPAPYGHAVDRIDIHAAAGRIRQMGINCIIRD